MDFTQKQKRAIDTDSGTVLVSAAAGSGKTSVLSERVARLVLGGADIHNMLVVTFTNAAAAEMRRRIGTVLYRYAGERADSRLLLQSELVGAADVSTFHSFCAKVVRENFAVAEVAPDFRILDDAERTSLRHSTLRELFDTLYEQRDEGLQLLLKRHTTRANDAQLAQVVLHVYDVMMGQPNPYDWALKATEMDESEYTALLRSEYEQMLAGRLEDAVLLMKRAQQVCMGLDEAQHLKDMATVEELEAVLRCVDESGLLEAQTRYAACKIPALARQTSEEVKDRTKELRSEARKHLKAFLTDETVDCFEETVRRQVAHTREDVRALMGVISLFDKMYGVKKREQNALDYEDLQHKALAVLQQNGEEYQGKYQHIFVDEYQDTNPVQEEIVQAMRGDNCLFLVGDIKQSIYRFRLADPGIFKKRASEYGKQGQQGELILMNDNFRSADGVIRAVNYLMERVMSERLGEVHYDEQEQLFGVRAGGQAEILLCQAGGGETGEDEDAEQVEHSADEAQAGMIARHIKETLQTEIEDRKTGEMRQVRYDDIALLMRSRSGLTAELRRAFEAQGIPYALSMEESRDMPEVELFVHLLRVIENPLQDIPLLSVMRSFIGQMDEQDFAVIRIDQNDGEVSFSQAALRYAQEGGNELAGRLRVFFERLAVWRQKSRAQSLHDFIPMLRQELEFDEWLLLAADGNAKKEALDALVGVMEQLAAQQGNSLYLLLKALHDLKKREGAYVKTQGLAQQGEHVRMMTIHGAKGLEFPIVYVAGLNKKFNTKDTRQDFLTHSEFGVTACYVDETERIKEETVERIVIREKILQQNRSEELRMLYVAMTRAMDRLYLAGCVEDMEKQAEKWSALAGRYDKAASMLDWIMAANLHEKAIPVNLCTAQGGRAQKEPFDFEAFRRAAVQKHQPTELLSIPNSERVPAKLSVSAVKKSQGKGVASFLTPQTAEEEEITGARLGTLVHSLMESVVKTGDGLDIAAKRLLDRYIIGQEEYEALLKNKWMAEGFLQGELYQRIKKAERVLYEQPFNLRMTAKELGYEVHEDMLIQGILDLAFLENGQWVLVDYKTDRVDEQTILAAAQGYKVQLDLYARALEEITGTPVKSRYLYFLRPGREVEV